MNSRTSVPEPVPGTRPEGARDEATAARRVREMFAGIAPRYDFLNHLLSLSLDRVWRRRAAERVADSMRRLDARALDLCCGTGDLAFALERVARRVRGCAPAESLTLIGNDFVLPMLLRARQKAARRSSGVFFVEADALALPFSDDTFDLVSSAFGFRNLANYERGLAEIYRVLRPRGLAAILEFSEPRASIFAAIYRFYFEDVLPWLGGAISGSRSSYAYLPQSVAGFSLPEELAVWMERAGFVGVSFESWTGGIVTLHLGRKS